jgi:hypothetical protein
MDMEGAIYWQANPITHHPKVGLLSNKNKLRYGSGFGVGVYNVRF